MIPILDPNNELMFDMATDHRKIVHGAFMNAIREITGKDIDDEDMRQHAGIETPTNDLSHVDYVYKKQVILRVYAPTVTRNPLSGRLMKVDQRILQVWKKNARNRRN